ncbi:MAG: methionyl-tRNA formyltransferase [Terriglobales bacterium]
MRIVFLGTPDFAVPSLEKLARQPGIEVTAAVCQPDRPSGRRAQVEAPAVKRAALALGIPVYQPERMRGAEALAWLAAGNPEALAVVAFGQLLPAPVFSLPRLGAINAHASLLPAYRGAAPIQWALAQGEHRTGVTTMCINAGLDTGDILLQRAVDIVADETTVELSRRLALLAADLMAETFARLAAGSLAQHPQPPGATLAPRLTREDGAIDWHWPAAMIYNRWRGFQPWPGIHTRFRGRQLAILRCRPLPEATGEPGLLLDQMGTPAVACGAGALLLEQVRLEGRQATAGGDFVRGARLAAGGERLGESLG